MVALYFNINSYGQKALQSLGTRCEESDTDLYKNIYKCSYSC